jgi:hypothetical protein
MGIRVHKYIGYGVRDLKCRRSRYSSATMLDTRVDWKKLYGNGEKAWGTQKEKFEKWCRRNMRWLRELYQREYPARRVLKPKDIKLELFLMFDGMEDRWRLNECYTHQDEFGDPKVMLFQPPQCKDWRRYDDTIDYVEESEKYKQHGRVLPLSGAGIWPYCHSWIRFRDPPEGMFDEKSRLPFNAASDDKGPVMLSPGDYSMLVGKWDPKQPPQAKEDMLKHYKEDWRPALPFGVVAVVAWLNCFTDIEAFLDDLRPMLYVYWG